MFRTRINGSLSPKESNLQKNSIRDCGFFSAFVACYHTWCHFMWLWEKQDEGKNPSMLYTVQHAVFLCSSSSNRSVCVAASILQRQQIIAYFEWKRRAKNLNKQTNLVIKPFRIGYLENSYGEIIHLSFFHC